ncbi:MAG: hypothetical protein IKN47_04630 [Lachnospiraceae bacterium]|nr:hypothetical protein [Lachnospiraceae bacterium]
MKLSALISDGMVLQRGKENYIWGSDCAADSVVEVLIDGNRSAGIADKEGKFKVLIPPVNTGGPYKIKIKVSDPYGRNEDVSINNVMCGDVFLLAGQSNMEIPLCRCLDLHGEEISRMNLPDVHYFEVVKEYAFGDPVEELYEGNWQEATQENLYPMSALGVFFAQYHMENTGVPVGLIQTGVGGTHIESYLSEDHVISVGELLRKEALKRGEDISKCDCDKNDSCKVCYEKQLKMDKDKAWVEKTSADEVKAQQEWYDKLNSKDIGLKEHWEKLTSLYDDPEQARYLSVPGRWEDLEENKDLESLRGSVWVLKTVDIPESFVGKDIKLYLGTLVDADETYVNGIKVGETAYRYPPRRYVIPAGILKAGANTITVRIVANARSGGFVLEMPYYLALGDEKISLEGKWQFKIGGTSYSEKDGCYEDFKDITFFTWKPTAQYNRMVYPLKNLKFSAVLFYQGESNCTHAWEYEYLMVEMVDCLRELFNDDLPFGFVELPMFGGEDTHGDTTQWDNLRLAQERAAAKIPNSTIADIYDLGFTYELHPQTKKEAAKRLYDKMKELMKW